MKRIWDLATHRTPDGEYIETTQQLEYADGEWCGITPPEIIAEVDEMTATDRVERNGEEFRIAREVYDGSLGEMVAYCLKWDTLEETKEETGTEADEADTEEKITAKPFFNKVDFLAHLRNDV